MLDFYIKDLGLRLILKNVHVIVMKKSKTTKNVHVIVSNKSKITLVTFLYTHDICK